MARWKRELAQLIASPLLARNILNKSQWVHANSKLLTKLIKVKPACEKLANSCNPSDLGALLKLLYCCFCVVHLLSSENEGWGVGAWTIFVKNVNQLSANNGQNCGFWVG